MLFEEGGRYRTNGSVLDIQGHESGAYKEVLFPENFDEVILVQSPETVFGSNLAEFFTEDGYYSLDVKREDILEAVDYEEYSISSWTRLAAESIYIIAETVSENTDFNPPDYNGITKMYWVETTWDEERNIHGEEVPIWGAVAEEFPVGDYAGEDRFDGWEDELSNLISQMEELAENGEIIFHNVYFGSNQGFFKPGEDVIIDNQNSTVIPLDPGEFTAEIKNQDLEGFLEKVSKTDVPEVKPIASEQEFNTP